MSLHKPVLWSLHTTWAVLPFCSKTNWIFPPFCLKKCVEFSRHFAQKTRIRRPLIYDDLEYKTKKKFPKNDIRRSYIPDYTVFRLGKKLDIWKNQGKNCQKKFSKKTSKFFFPKHIKEERGHFRSLPVTSGRVFTH